MKIGDRVRVKPEYVMEYGEDDFIGTIIHINKYGDIVGIEFDKGISNGHSCQGKGKFGYCWNVDYRDVIIEGDISNFKEELDKITL